MRWKTTLEVEREGEGGREIERYMGVVFRLAPVELTLLIILSSKGCRAVNSLSTST